MEVRKVAVQYIKMLNLEQKRKLKTMLNHGIICCSDFAKKHNIEPVELTRELKEIFRGK